MLDRVALVVDDDGLLCVEIKRVLEDQGWRVVVAHTGHTALFSVLKLRDQLALAVIDLIMPGMSGLQLIQAIRHGDAAPCVPIVAISGAYGEGSGIRDRVAAEDAIYLDKPFRRPMLAQAVVQAEWRAQHMAPPRRWALRKPQPEAPDSEAILLSMPR